jgi:hypothetical protein
MLSYITQLAAIVNSHFRGVHVPGPKCNLCSWSYCVDPIYLVAYLFDEGLPLHHARDKFCQAGSLRPSLFLCRA